MFLVYPREVFIFDLAISQIVGVIQLEKNQASICQVKHDIIKRIREFVFTLISSLVF